jgi:hypothetical protein
MSETPYLAIAFALALVYICACLLFWSLYGNEPTKPIPLWWHFVVGPVALIVSARRRPSTTFSHRETVGWMAVLLFMLVVVIWKVFSVA